MESLENSAQFIEGGVEDAFVPPALKFDFIYQYMTNVDWKYLAQIPSYKQPAYQLKRLWLLIANGFVPEWHASFIPTKLGNTIINTINNKIFSGQLLFEAEDKLSEDEIEDKRKWLINTYLDEKNPEFEDQLERLSWNAMASGASAFVAKVDRDGNLYFSAYREDKYLPTFVDNRLDSIRLFSSVYNSIDSGSILQGEAAADMYVLEDYRYKSNGKAYSILRVFQQGNGEINSIVDTNPVGLTYDDMPEKVAKAINRKIGNRLNKPVELHFGDRCPLGVKILNNTKSSAYFDMPGYSDSILAPAVEQLFEYDRSYTTMINDIALGRGQVLIPDSMDAQLSQLYQGNSAMAQLASALSRQNMLNNKVYRKIPVANPENIKPEPIQFDMRIEQHLQSLKGQRICIFNAIGINPGSIDPTIDESGHAKTATEVIADEQNLITFVQQKRKGIVKVADWAIGVVLYHYFGEKENKIHMKFTNGNLSNALLVSQMAVSEFAAGIRSKESAVAKINANDGKSDIDKEVQKIEESNGGLGFADNESDSDADLEELAKRLGSGYA